jgi:predicted  nucleic acid-binding Zn-ribbon protein
MEKSIEKQLDLLLELQTIDKRIGEIIQMRGDLPQEVKKLEEDITDLEGRTHKYQEEITTLEENIKVLRGKMKEAEGLVKRYEEQQMNVRNNREYDAITKEIELQRLEIQLSEKKIKDAYEQIEKRKAEIENLASSIKDKAHHLQGKQEELQAVVADSQENEQSLHKKREKLVKSIDKSFLQTYEKIRKNARNNLAVVLVKAGACTGCFTMVYPQMQAEIREKNQLISCEHCGRIMAAVADPLVIDQVVEGLV